MYEMKEGGEVMGNASFWEWVIYCPHKLMGVVITAYHHKTEPISILSWKGDGVLCGLILS